MTRILVVDDHALVRRGLIELLQSLPVGVEFGEAGTGAEALRLALGENWDVVLLDLGLPDRHGLDVLRELHAARPQLPVLILTMFPEDQLALRVLELGAAGYLTKESAPEELLRALERVIGGHKYLSPSMAQAVADGLGGPPPAPHEQLSDRELEVLRLLAAGRPITAISRQLGLSPKTVTTYRARLLHKLRMKSNAELTFYATQHGLVSPAALRATS
ncbi:MAG TPA: response regulator transcription factor [Gemmatimonadales bacterium]|nr:response regulator transcription factor [Gemmatimonadales bacterium]